MAVRIAPKAMHTLASLCQGPFCLHLSTQAQHLLQTFPLLVAHFRDLCSCFILFRLYFVILKQASDMEDHLEAGIDAMRVQALIYGIREVAITDSHYRQLVTRSALDFLNRGLAQFDEFGFIAEARHQIEAGNLTFDDGTATSAGLPLADLAGIRAALANTVAATPSDQDTVMQDTDNESDLETPEGTSFTMPTHDDHASLPVDAGNFQGQGRNLNDSAPVPSTSASAPSTPASVPTTTSVPSTSAPVPSTSTSVPSNPASSGRATRSTARATIANTATSSSPQAETATDSDRIIAAQATGTPGPSFSLFIPIDRNELLELRRQILHLAIRAREFDRAETVLLSITQDHPVEAVEIAEQAEALLDVSGERALRNTIASIRNTSTGSSTAAATNDGSQPPSSTPAVITSRSRSNRKRGPSLPPPLQVKKPRTDATTATTTTATDATTAPRKTSRQPSGATSRHRSSRDIVKHPTPPDYPWGSSWEFECTNANHEHKTKEGTILGPIRRRSRKDFHRHMNTEEGCGHNGDMSKQFVIIGTDEEKMEWIGVRRDKPGELIRGPMRHDAVWEGKNPGTGGSVPDRKYAAMRVKKVEVKTNKPVWGPNAEEEDENEDDDDENDEDGPEDAAE